MKYIVHQRRMMLKALETQAMCIAYVNPEEAAKAMENYLSVAMPVDPAEIEAAARSKEAQLEEVANMAPFTLNDLSFGNPIGSTDAPDFTSMHRPPGR